MFSLLRRSARLLLEAGAFASLPLALVGPVLWPGQAPANTYRLVGAVHVSEGQARLEAMKVELAWLADPISYQYPLKITVVGDDLKATGEVPNDGTRQRVLAVARQACYLSVLDGLVVRGSRSDSAGMGNPIERARAALASHLRMPPTAFDITLKDGQLILRGAVDSVERKVEASRCLRGLPGVQSIVNCLVVSSVINGGPGLTLVTTPIEEHGSGVVTQADHTIPSGLPGGVSTADVGPTLPQVRRAFVPVVLPPSPSKAVPSGLPIRQCVYIKMHAPQGEVPTSQPVVYLVPTTGFASPPPMSMPAPTLLAPTYPGNACCGPIAVDHRMVHDKPRLLERLMPFLFLHRHPCPPPQYPGFYAHASLTGASAGVPSVTVPTPTDGKESNGGEKEEEKPKGEDRDKGAKDDLTHTWPPAHHVRPAGTPSRPLARFTSRPQPSSGPAHTVVPVAGRQVDPGQRIQPIPASPATPPAPAEPTRPAVQAIAAHAWNGATPAHPAMRVQPAPSHPPVATRTRPLDPTQMRKRIQQQCGKLARDVRIQVGQDRSVLVHVYAAPAAEQHLVSKLLSMPELTASHIRLQVHLAP